MFSSPKESKRSVNPDDPKFQDGVNLIYALLKDDLLREKLWKKITPTMQKLLDITEKDVPALDKLSKIREKVAGLGSKGSDVFARLVEEKKGDTPYDLSNFNFKPEEDIPKLKMQKGFFKGFKDERDVLYYLIMMIMQPLAEDAKAIIETLGTDQTVYCAEDDSSHAKYYVDPQKFIENAFKCVANLKYLITDKDEMSTINKSLIATMQQFELKSRNLLKR